MDIMCNATCSVALQAYVQFMTSSVLQVFLLVIKTFALAQLQLLNTAKQLKKQMRTGSSSVQKKKNKEKQSLFFMTSWSRLSPA